MQGMVPSAPSTLNSPYAYIRWVDNADLFAIGHYDLLRNYRLYKRYLYGET